MYDPVTRVGKLTQRRCGPRSKRTGRSEKQAGAWKKKRKLLARRRNQKRWKAARRERAIQKGEKF